MTATMYIIYIKEIGDDFMSNETILKFLKKELITQEIASEILEDEDFKEGVEILRKLIKDYEGFHE